MKITVEDKEYDIDEKDEDIMGVVRTLSTGSNSLKILNLMWHNVYRLSRILRQMN